MKKAEIFHQLLGFIPPLTILVSISCFLASCAIPRVVDDGSQPYPGLARQIELPMTEQAPKGTVHIVITHGMGHDPRNLGPYCEFKALAKASLDARFGTVSTKDEASANEVLLSQETEALNDLRTVGVRRRNPQKLEEYINAEGGDSIYKTQRIKWVNGPNVHDVTFHWIGYSWYLAWLRQELGETDKKLWQGSSYFANRLIKQKIMNGGFPDAVSYLNSDHRTVVQNHFYRCFDRIAKTMEPNDQVAFVSSSLGSRVLLDSLKGAAGFRARSPFQAGRESLAGNTSHFFMFANQIPLLGLGNEDDGFEALVKARASNLERFGPTGVPKELTVVAFGDPSDLLTYYLDEHKYTQAGKLKIRITNVNVRNAGFAFYPVFRDPSSAHSGYRRNKGIMKRIVHGNRSR